MRRDNGMIGRMGRDEINEIIYDYINKDKPIIFNRYVLRELIDNEKDISNIISKAVAFRITTEKMLRNKINRLSITYTFDADEWIEKQEEKIKTTRADFVEHNKRLLNLVIEAKGNFNK